MSFHFKPICVGALLLLVVTGCTKAGRDASRAGGGEDLFASPRVVDIAIDIAPAALTVLKHNEERHSYVRCTVRSGHETVANAGVRCRGNAPKEFASGKPDLIVTPDKFVSDQQFLGQKRLVLQASRDDPSYLGAPIALEMFRQANVPAPRCAFARVELNGQSLGLYVIIEGVEREFLERHFDSTKGNLYDEGDPPDVTGKLEKARGRDRKDQSDVDALAAAALQSDPGERWKQLRQRLDLDRFLAFTALEVLLWQDDSYALEAGKFRLYHDPKSDLMVFFPKNVEGVLKKTDGPILPKCKGVVAKAVLMTPEGQEQYRKTVARLLDTVFNPGKVQAGSQQIVATIRPAIAATDPAAVSAFDAAVAEFHDAVARRAAFAAEQLKASGETAALQE